MSSLIDHLPVVNDFPRPGVRFRDLSPLLADGPVFAQAVDGLAALARESRCQLLAGVESRGLIFASAVALRLGCGFALLRKPGKLPPPVLRENTGAMRWNCSPHASRRGCACCWSMT